MSSQGDSPVGAEEKRMRLRYSGVCRACGLRLPAGASAVYDPASRTVRCLECPAGQAPTADPLPEVPDAGNIGYVHGSAGASARREFEHRSSVRAARVRANHPRLGGLLLALFDDPQSTRGLGDGRRR